MLTRRLSTPAIQLVSAGVTFVIWFLMGKLIPSSLQTMPVQVYSYGVALSLPMTFGIPFLIPNLFREAPRDSWHRTGPWSPAATLATLIPGAFAFSGLITVLVSARESYVSAIGLSISIAAMLAMSTLALQLARLSDSARIAFFSTIGSPLIPLAWLVLLSWSADIYLVSIVFNLVTLLVYGLLVMQVKGRLQKLTRNSLPAVRRMLRMSLPLLPHLAGMGLLMQGVRLGTTLLDFPSRAILAGHYLMLIVGVGMTIVSTIHALLSASVQSSPASEFERNRVLAVRGYSALGATGGLTIALVLAVAAPVIFAPVDEASVGQRILLATTLPSMCAYYCLSSLALRIEKSARLAFVSLLALGFLYLFGIFAAHHDLDLLIAQYSLVLAIMPIILGLLIGGKGGVSWESIWKSYGVIALGYFPVAVVFFVALVTR